MKLERVMLLLLDSLAGKKFQIHCLPPRFETSSVVLKHMGILRLIPEFFVQSEDLKSNERRHSGLRVQKPN
ncbi:hypothetical protein CMV_020249 [Castanea mollissima]|uniref:Uncharacterized protein n=1 Tax=Castanea mollissima TaxID=60419 RepID=A0A8J4QLZ5_9ROSI|nr:hypothetical protein CMV_020249 [Castanea mollissima]